MAVVLLLACLGAAILVDRACLQATPASASQRGEAAGRKATIPAAVGFATGACRSLPPTGKSRNRVIFVDAGHGGLDPGVTSRSPAGSEVKESTLTLAIATELSRILRAHGYGIVLSRTSNTTVFEFGPDATTGGVLSSSQVRQDLEARARCANSSRAAALVSIHINAHEDPTVRGSLTIYDAARTFAADSHRLADSLQSALVSQLDVTDRGVVTDDALQAPALSDRAGTYGHLILLGPTEPGWVDEATSMPGAVVEPLFLTSPADAALAASSGGQRRIASAIADGVQNYMSGTPAH